MALRDKLVERTRPHLEPDEQIYAVMMAQSGPSPYWVFLTWLTMFWNRYLIVLVTDRSIVTFRATAFKPSFVKQPPEMTRAQLRILGPCTGLWGKVEIDGTTFHVHKRFHKDVAAGDAYVASLGGTQQPEQPTRSEAQPAGWFPDPQGVATQRYWDGTTWTEHTA